MNKPVSSHSRSRGVDPRSFRGLPFHAALVVKKGKKGPGEGERGRYTMDGRAKKERTPNC
ncbi:hypothetical protein AKJ62_03530 [candidate division MSBL1 archaeon SCGC-AAA259D14]|uniref:Uncharacterized protein n=1 Tax=candidate division MSBL1 archaeon SCGC-AAA259D14 TaxID=1698261 RepID=A0A133U4V3_9EURY|nr:hypothetical protein AKJ62_03530 [candidate division MSBL1 archaeon SCGC-AAA259D14]